MPRRYTNKQIQRKADRILEDLVSELFNDINCELYPHDQNNQEDRGIDWIYEIVDKQSHKTVLSFYLQNKGTTTLRKITNKKNENHGKLSKQFDLRNIVHYRDEIFEPVLITLCDTTTKKVYWHPIQLDEIDSRIQSQIDKEISTIQIYFDPKREITKTNLKQLAEDIETSKSTQSRKHEDQEPAIIKLIEKSLQDKDSENHIILEIEKTFKKFESLPILPSHIFPKLYPFRKSKDDRSYYSVFSLYTSNQEIIDFFDNIKLQAGKYTLKKPDKKLEKHKDYQESIKNVISILQHHLIDHIQHVKDRKKRICLHNLFTYNTKCGCIKCTFERLDFKKSYNSFPSRIQNKEEWEELKIIYLQYQFGLIKKAYKSYTSKSKKYKKKGKLISYFICLYNIKKLKNIFVRNYFEEDREEIVETIDSIDLEIVLANLKNELSVEQIEVLNWILTEKFIDRTFWKIDEVVTEILNSYETDQNGGYSRNKKSNELLNLLAGTSLFIRSNLLIFDNYEEYQRILMKSFEGFIASYSIGNEESSHLKEFTDYLLGLALMYGNTKRLKFLFRKYQIKLLDYNPNRHSSFSPLVQKALNLFNSKEEILNIVGFDDERPNFFFRDKVNQLISNLLVLTSHIAIKPKDFKYLSKGIIKMIKDGDKLYQINKDSFRYFIGRKKSLINVSDLMDLAKHLFDQERFDFSREMTIILDELSERDDSFKLSDIQNFTSEYELWVKDEKLSVREIEEILTFKDLLSRNQLSKLKSRIKNGLKKKFNSRLYYSAVINDVIEAKGYLNDYIKTIPKTKNEVTFAEVFSGEKDKKNYKLDQFINLAFYKNIDLKSKKIQSLSNGEPYYNWLLNLDDFDYEDFDPYWLLHHRTSIYKGEFKKHRIIKEKVESYLKEKNNKSIMKLYLELWGQNASV